MPWPSRSDAEIFSESPGDTLFVLDDVKQAGLWAVAW